MDGLIIVILTFACVACFVLVVWASERGLEALNVLYNDTGTNDHVAAKTLLLLPYIALALWVFVLQVLLFAGAFLAVVSFANRLRNWWQRGITRQ